MAGSSCLLQDSRDVLKNCDYLLESFYSIQEWQIPYIKQTKMFLLDSGAFSLFTKGHNLSKQELEEYVDKYIDFINKYDIQYFFELDIDRIIGLEEVERIRKKIEKETGKKSIPVWHKERGWKYFEKMCDEYDYIAIGGIAKNPNGRQIEKLFPYFIKYAHKKGCKIHGLGYTNTNKLTKYRFDTVDSTTWLSGCQFGSLPYFTGKSIKNHKKKENTRLKTKNGGVAVIQKYSFNEWLKFQKYADKYLQKGGEINENL